MTTKPTRIDQGSYANFIPSNSDLSLYDNNASNGAGFSDCQSPGKIKFNIANTRVNVRGCYSPENFERLICLYFFK